MSRDKTKGSFGDFPGRTAKRPLEQSIDNPSEEIAEFSDPEATQYGFINIDNDSEEFVQTRTFKRPKLVHMTTPAVPSRAHQVYPSPSFKNDNEHTKEFQQQVNLILNQCQKFKEAWKYEHPASSFLVALSGALNTNDVSPFLNFSIFEKMETSLKNEIRNYTQKQVKSNIISNSLDVIKKYSNIQHNVKKVLWNLNEQRSNETFLDTVLSFIDSNNWVKIPESTEILQQQQIQQETPKSGLLSPAKTNKAPISSSTTKPISRGLEAIYEESNIDEDIPGGQEKNDEPSSFMDQSKNIFSGARFQKVYGSDILSELYSAGTVDPASKRVGTWELPIVLNDYKKYRDLKKFNITSLYMQSVYMAIHPFIFPNSPLSPELTSPQSRFVDQDSQRILKLAQFYDYVTVKHVGNVIPMFYRTKVFLKLIMMRSTYLHWIKLWTLFIFLRNFGDALMEWSNVDTKLINKLMGHIAYCLIHMAMQLDFVQKKRSLKIQIFSSILKPLQTEMNTTVSPEDGTDEYIFFDKVYSKEYYEYCIHMKGILGENENDLKKNLNIVLENDQKYPYLSQILQRPHGRYAFLNFKKIQDECLHLFGGITDTILPQSAFRLARPDLIGPHFDKLPEWRRIHISNKIMTNHLCGIIFSSCSYSFFYKCLVSEFGDATSTLFDGNENTVSDYEYLRRYQQSNNIDNYNSVNIFESTPDSRIITFILPSLENPREIQNPQVLGNFSENSKNVHPKFLWFKKMKRLFATLLPLVFFEWISNISNNSSELLGYLATALDSTIESKSGSKYYSEHARATSINQNEWLNYVKGLLNNDNGSPELLLNSDLLPILYFNEIDSVFELIKPDLQSNTNTTFLQNKKDRMIFTRKRSDENLSQNEHPLDLLNIKTTEDIYKKVENTKTLNNWQISILIENHVYQVISILDNIGDSPRGPSDIYMDNFRNLFSCNLYILLADTINNIQEKTVQRSPSKISRKKSVQNIKKFYSNLIKSFVSDDILSDSSTVSPVWLTPSEYFDKESRKFIGKQNITWRYPISFALDVTQEISNYISASSHHVTFVTKSSGGNVNFNQPQKRPTSPISPYSYQDEPQLLTDTSPSSTSTTTTTLTTMPIDTPLVPSKRQQVRRPSISIEISDDLKTLSYHNYTNLHSKLGNKMWDILIMNLKRATITMVDMTTAFPLTRTTMETIPSNIRESYMNRTEAISKNVVELVLPNVLETLIESEESYNQWHSISKAFIDNASTIIGEWFNIWRDINIAILKLDSFLDHIIDQSTNSLLLLEEQQVIKSHRYFLAQKMAKWERLKSESLENVVNEEESLDLTNDEPEEDEEERANLQKSQTELDKAFLLSLTDRYRVILSSPMTIWIQTASHLNENSSSYTLENFVRDFEKQLPVNIHQSVLNSAYKAYQSVIEYYRVINPEVQNKIVNNPKNIFSTLYSPDFYRGSDLTRRRTQNTLAETNYNILTNETYGGLHLILYCVTPNVQQLFADIVSQEMTKKDRIRPAPGQYVQTIAVKWSGDKQYECMQQLATQFKMTTTNSLYGLDAYLSYGELDSELNYRALSQKESGNGDASTTISNNWYAPLVTDSQDPSYSIHNQFTSQADLESLSMQHLHAAKFEQVQY